MLGREFGHERIHCAITLCPPESVKQHKTYQLGQATNMNEKKTLQMQRDKFWESIRKNLFRQLKDVSFSLFCGFVCFDG